MSCTNRVGTSPHLGHPQISQSNPSSFTFKAVRIFMFFRCVSFFFWDVPLDFGFRFRGFFWGLRDLSPWIFLGWGHFPTPPGKLRIRCCSCWRLPEKKVKIQPSFWSKLTSLPKNQGWPNHCILQPLAKIHPAWLLWVMYNSVGFLSGGLTVCRANIEVGISCT